MNRCFLGGGGDYMMYGYIVETTRSAGHLLKGCKKNSVFPTHKDKMPKFVKFTTFSRPGILKQNNLGKFTTFSRPEILEIKFQTFFYTFSWEP